MTNLKAVEEKMSKAVEAMRRSLVVVRTGKASPAMVEGIKVEYYGTPTPLNQIAAITAPEARLLEIKPWDKNALADIEKAIQKSELGLNPINDGKVIRLQVPQPTEERRKELMKVVKKLAEDGRIAIRAIRREANEEVDKAKQAKSLSDDEVKRQKDRIQQLTDKFMAMVDQVLAAKEKEILEF